jgi:hypothetical protein
MRLPSVDAVQRATIKAATACGPDVLIDMTRAVSPSQTTTVAANIAVATILM